MGVGVLVGTTAILVVIGAVIGAVFGAFDLFCMLGIEAGVCCNPNVLGA
jgi:hypothetical protein